MVVTIIVGFPLAAIRGVGWCRHWKIFISIFVISTIGYQCKGVSYLDEGRKDGNIRKSVEAQVV